jgi:hypothetical protein
MLWIVAAPEKNETTASSDDVLLFWHDPEISEITINKCNWFDRFDG